MMILKVIDGKTDGLYENYKVNLQDLYDQITLRLTVFSNLLDKAPAQMSKEQATVIKKQISKALKEMNKIGGKL